MDFPLPVSPVIIRMGEMDREWRIWRRWAVIGREDFWLWREARERLMIGAAGVDAVEERRDSPGFHILFGFVGVGW